MKTQCLGGFGLTPEDVATRDALVLDQIRQRGLPCVTITSGGYNRLSAGLIAGMINRSVNPV